MRKLLCKLDYRYHKLMATIWGAIHHALHSENKFAFNRAVHHDCVVFEYETLAKYYKIDL